MPTTSGFCFRVNHGIKQKPYVDWKYQALSQFVRTAPRVYRNSYYFRTISHREFSGYREWFYPMGYKVAPIDLLATQLSALGLAVWIMDDGAADGKQLRLNTQSFSTDEGRGLVELLRAKFGLRTTINVDKGLPRLRFRAESMDRLRDLISPYVIPDMLYKLPL